MPFDGRGRRGSTRQRDTTSAWWRAYGRATAAGSCAWRARCESGQVFVNNYGAGGGVELPFGGVKHSGHGREKGFEALYGFTVAEDRRAQARLSSRPAMTTATNKIAIVTGARLGLRRGIAQTFAAEGAKVVVNDLNVANGERVASEIARRRRRARRFCPGDVAKDADVEAPGRRSRIAGVRRPATSSSTTRARRTATSRCWTCQRRAVRPDLRGQRQEPVPHGAARRAVFRARRQRRLHHDRFDGRRAPAAGPHLVQRQQRRGDRDARSMAAELAPDNIRVNVINPVAGETAMLADFMGAGHAGAARAIHRDDSAGTTVAAFRCGDAPRCSSPPTRPRSSPARALKWTAVAAFSCKS